MVSVGTVADKVPDYIQWPSSGPLEDMRGGVAQGRPDATIQSVVLGFKLTLCHWSRQSGSIRLDVGGQNQ